jgi:hypothetical protein
MRANPKVPPKRPTPERLRQLQELSDLHLDWVNRHVNGSGFTARDGETDYPLLHLDVDGASPEAEDEFQQQARRIMGLDAARARLSLVDQDNGATVGWVDEDLTFSDASTAELFRSIAAANGWGDDRAFDALAAGWSDGPLAGELDEAFLDEIERAEGQDEDDEILRALMGNRYKLREFWTTDPRGLAKWADKPHPWTSLYRHLRRHVGSIRAKRMAAQWYHVVFHQWPGERKGNNPLGPG